ncbi:hypothetical protein DL95DRAFT_469829 [Leptodontidium sp. 2 PMI_412]|nr:hypothetical protein DL95DRAFT_469829 [Leptodontidium sp. 2 PMI_412]
MSDTKRDTNPRNLSPESNEHAEKDPMGVFMMSPDGIMRSFGPPPKRIVVDAIGLSPAQIEQTMDMQPWHQETEDKFRGVDGRKVVDHEVLFNPPDEQATEVVEGGV